MKKILLFALLFAVGASSLQARYHKKIRKSYQDKDLDGVIDKRDRCPNTPFFAIVNKNGCMIKRLNVSKEQERKVKEILTRRN